MKDETILAVVAMVMIGVLLAVALYMGYNGVLLASGIGILAGLGGYEVGKRQKETEGSSL